MAVSRPCPTSRVRVDATIVATVISWREEELDALTLKMVDKLVRPFRNVDDESTGKGKGRGDTHDVTANLETLMVKMTSSCALMVAARGDRGVVKGEVKSTGDSCSFMGTEVPFLLLSAVVRRRGAISTTTGRRFTFYGGEG